MIKKIKKGELSKIASGVITDQEDYEVTDFPVGGITNAQMAAALTAQQEGFYLIGSVYLCTDTGEKGIATHLYKFTGSGWEDVTPGLMLRASVDPDASTVAKVGQFYLNTSTQDLWQCFARTPEGCSFRKIITSAGGTFDTRPRVKANGESYEVLLRSDAEDFVAAQSESQQVPGQDKYYLQVLNDAATFSISVHRNSDVAELYSIYMDKDRLLINNLPMPSLRHFANVPASTIFTTLSPAKIKRLTLKFKADTNMKGCSYDVKTSASGQSVSGYTESDAAMIIVANETMVFNKSFSYESNYEFTCGNYKLSWNGVGVPKICYYGIQYTASAGAHWIEAMTTSDFAVDAEVEVEI